MDRLVQGGEQVETSRCQDEQMMSDKFVLPIWGRKKKEVIGRDPSLFHSSNFHPPLEYGDPIILRSVISTRTPPPVGNQPPYVLSRAYE